MGALSMNGDASFRDGFGPLLTDAVRVPWNDLPALEAALRRQRRRGVLRRADPGQGRQPAGARAISRKRRACASKHGALFVADEVQTGLGRTGKFLAIEHDDVDPDLVLLAKALSGGFVPVGAVVGKQLDLRPDVRSHGSRRRARLDVRQEQPRDGGRARDAGGARGRGADRERGPPRREPAAPARRARSASTSSSRRCAGAA